MKEIIPLKCFRALSEKIDLVQLYELINMRAFYPVEFKLQRV